MPSRESFLFLLRWGEGRLSPLILLAPLCRVKQSDPEIGIKKKNNHLEYQVPNHLRKQWLCLDFQTAFVKPMGWLLQSIFCTESWRNKREGISPVCGSDCGLYRSFGEGTFRERWARTRDSMKGGRQDPWAWISWLERILQEFQFSSVQLSRSVVSDSLWPHESKHARPPCPSPTPGVHSDSHPSSQWCHPAISSSVVPFSSCPKSLPASGSFPMSQFFSWGGQSIGVSALASVLPKKSQGWMQKFNAFQPVLEWIIGLYRRDLLTASCKSSNQSMDIDRTLNECARMCLLLLNWPQLKLTPGPVLVICLYLPQDCCNRVP